MGDRRAEAGQAGPQCTAAQTAERTDDGVVAAGLHGRFAEFMRRLLAFAAAIAIWLPLPGAAQVPQTFLWREDATPVFGGWSGLWMAPDGLSLKAVSDKGRFVEATLTRTDGAITGVEVTRLGPIQEREGKTAPLGFLQDAEGLAIAPDGAIYISFEGHHRVRRWADFDQEPEQLHPIRFFYHLQVNSGFEALAVDDAGVVYAVPERSGRWERPFPVWRLKDGEWDDALSLTRRDKFLVADAAFGPDGRFYLLEREFVWYSGFRNRLRRFVLGPDGFDGGEELWRSSFGAYDNLEGLSVWRNENGGLTATMISDDNFNPLQDTWLVELPVPE